MSWPRRRITGRSKGRNLVRVATTAQYQPIRNSRRSWNTSAERLTLYRGLQVPRATRGAWRSIRTLHRLQRVRRRLPGREQHAGRRQGRRSATAARCTGCASTATTPATSTTPDSYHQPMLCQHCENGAVRGGLPGGGHRAQRRRPERDGLQPLRRHALLLEQLPVQGAPVQLPAVLRTSTRREPQAAAQPRRHRAQPRRHGEVHLLRAAHQPGARRGQARGPRRFATARW